jgi:hypothetical protein
MSKINLRKFQSSYIPVTESGCWLWIKHCSKHGYGRYHAEEAHRVSYFIHYGIYPAELAIDHLCRVRCCVNPLHLQLVTFSECGVQGGEAIRLKYEQGYKMQRAWRPMA